jgi:hypothetical protein
LILRVLDGEVREYLLLNANSAGMQGFEEFKLAM